MDCPEDLGVGVEVEVPKSYKELEESCRRRIGEILSQYPKARKVYKLLLEDPEVNACWDMVDYVAVKKLRFNDHGKTHAIVVTYFSLEMLELLKESGHTPDIVADVLGDKVKIVAIAIPPGVSTDHRIVSRIMYEGGRFIPF